ncbi:MAG: T9SS type A sorting domain-containing protein [Ignavibacteriaceae bacterium]
MKIIYINSTIILSFLLFPLVYAQEIEVITHGMTKYEPVGTLEIVIDFEVVNISALEQTVFEVRTINDVPAGWSSSMCFGDLCFSSDVDSVATTPEFNTPPLAPNDTLKTSLHVFTDQTSIATAHVQIQVGTFRNPEDRIILNFTTTTDPTVGVNETNILNSYYLYQNYPNPFNPSTMINYKVGEPGLVLLKIYNILGVEVATLVNEQKNSGNYSIDFNAADLSSGVYLYSLSINNFTQTRKMILEK